MIINEPKHMRYIHNWAEVPDGCYVVEDTYNELYQLKWIDNEPWLYHVGWRYQFGKPIEEFEARELDEPRFAGFEPDCMYDQPWLMECKEEDERYT